MKRRALAVAVVLLAVEILSAQGGDAVKAGKDKLKGTWILTSVEIGAHSFTDLDGKLAFQGDDVFLHVRGQPPREGTYTIRPSKNPKEIDLRLPAQGEQLVRAIYELEGDTLKVAFFIDEMQAGRPTALGMPNSVIGTFKRAKS